MTKEEINTFVDKHAITKTNERIEIVLKNGQKHIGFFDAQQPENRNLNKWTFTTLQDKKVHLINGEDIETINFYRFEVNNDNNGDSYIYRNGKYNKVN